tara:strand:+ start:910 stop:1041 length:132 start_codon:yes stop_codon:yes gene_type:complete
MKLIKSILIKQKSWLPALLIIILIIIILAVIGKINPMIFQYNS